MSLRRLAWGGWKGKNKGEMRKWEGNETIMSRRNFRNIPLSWRSLHRLKYCNCEDGTCLSGWFGITQKNVWLIKHKHMASVNIILRGCEINPTAATMYMWGVCKTRRTPLQHIRVNSRWASHHITLYYKSNICAQDINHIRDIYMKTWKCYWSFIRFFSIIALFCVELAFRRLQPSLLPSSPSLLIMVNIFLSFCYTFRVPKMSSLSSSIESSVLVDMKSVS